jgi:hypothetical protein
MIVNDELGKMGKEMIMIYLKALYQHYVGETEENHREHWEE